MPGASAAEAVNKFLNTVSQAVSCVKPTKVLVSEGGRRTLNAVHGLVVGPLKLSRVRRGAPVIVQLALNYMIIERQEQRRADRFKVSTQRYQHHVLANDRSELILFHWHPDTVVGPHLHVGELNKGQSLITSRHHIPSGRVSIEAVLRFLITDLGVRPDREDWANVLDACEGDFRRFATWGR